MRWDFLNNETQFGFAHRGGNTIAPENTVAAFSHAQSLGYRFLETDVHVTADGVLVAFHDDSLERITGRPGTISERSWDELSNIELEGGHSIPTMAELFETFPAAHFNIDPKANNAVEPLARTIQSHNALSRVCIGSFSDRRIFRMRKLLGPRLCTSPAPIHAGAILASAFTRWPATFGHAALQIPNSLGPIQLDAGIVERFQKNGFQVHVWTINERSEMERLLDLGVDAVMTDDVDLLAAVLAERGTPLKG